MLKQDYKHEIYIKAYIWKINLKQDYKHEHILKWVISNN